MMRPRSMPDTSAAQLDGAAPRGGLRGLVYGLRTEGGTPRQEIAAIAIGVFIGCLPVYGLHLAICWAVGWLFGLNRLKVYLAANISNPFVAPWLLFAEFQAGSWIRRGSFHAISIDTIRNSSVASLGADLLVGSVAVGGVLAVLAGWGTYATLRSSRANRHFTELVRRASDRYVRMSITAWEFARGKLRHDPVYRAAIYDDLLAVDARNRGPGPRTLLDVGCGQGLMLALLAEARRDALAGRWPGDAPPVFERLIGVETRPRVAAYAREALGADAEILTGDARTAAIPLADAALLFDVLHLMSASDQESLLASIVRSVRPGGVLVVRDADASAGWRFRAVKAGNRVKALAVGNWRQEFHFRSAAEWVACLDRQGLNVSVRPMGHGTPFANVLFTATVRAQGAAAPAATIPPSPAV
jgi:uncharacterized protein (DUF2062 family)/trans-aconitate methyltransferase